jgi:polyferredoxin
MIKIRARRIVQGLSLLLLHSSFSVMRDGKPANWFQANWLCLPVLSCHACSLAYTACPIGVLMHSAGWHLFPVFALTMGMLLVFGGLLGKFFCGWVCPFGTLQALLYRIPSPKLKMPHWTAYIKYAVLLVMVFLIPFFLGELTYGSFCRICPAAALQVAIPGWIKNGFSWSAMNAARIAVLIAVIVFVVMSSRSFCKVLCPIGALMAPLNRISLWAVKPPTEACISCGKCDRTCSTDINPSARILRDIPPSRHEDCIVCHECQPVCPVKGKTKDSPRK